MGFERKPWTHRSGSEKGGLFKSIDGGRTRNKLTSGLPKLLGRIGVRVAPSNPNVVYAIVESKEGTLYRSDDRGETFKQVSKNTSIVSRGFYYTRVRIDPNNENHVYAVASNLYESIDGGKAFKSITGKVHIDYHAFWQDAKNPKRIWVGQDGGVAVTYDGGENWEPVYNMPLGQFYQIHADNRLPFYYVMGGLQDNGAWTGPSRTREPGGIMNDDWRMISFGDGFYIINNADEPELYISESQGGNILRTDFRSREQQEVNPWGRGSGDGPALGQKFRFNWNAPILLSPHDKNTVYFGGNVVFRSTDFGKTWEQISGDLTTDDHDKQKDAGGPVAVENSTAEYHTTIISLAESPVQKGQLWAGTDDGNLQVTRDGGKVGQRHPRVSACRITHPYRISNLRGPTRKPPTSFDRHMFDDFRPYILRPLMVERIGDVAGNLPARPTSRLFARIKPYTLRRHRARPFRFLQCREGVAAAQLEESAQCFSSRHCGSPAGKQSDTATRAWHFCFDDATQFSRRLGSVKRDAHLFLFAGQCGSLVASRYGGGEKAFAGPIYGALITYYLKISPMIRPTGFKFWTNTASWCRSSISRQGEGAQPRDWNLRYGGAG